DGKLVFLGRTDHQIKLRGYRIEPGEIETVLRGVPGVRQAVVFTTRVADQDRLVAAVDSGTAEVQETQLRSALSASLPPYMVPTQFIITDSIPINRHGKVDVELLKQLANRTIQGQNDDDTGLLVNDDSEIKIGAIWSEMLG